jgi:predicted RNA-binding protein associated with RNAse of E/G family
VVHDLYVDIVVPPVSRRYEVLDLDELADALQDGAIDAATAVRVLRNAQRFIDKHLRNLDQEAPGSWPDFPPAAMLNLAELPPFDVG